MIGLTRKQPDIGHTIFPGCYHCYDDKHQSADGKDLARLQLLSDNHRLGNRHQSREPQSQGLEFEHPVDISDMRKEMNCAKCHTGAITQ